jgi:rubrerythrin
MLMYLLPLGGVKVFMTPGQKNETKYDLQVQRVLEEIRDSIRDEREDEMFYGHLARLAPSRQQRQIIEDIRDDERRHGNLFRRMYKDLTNREAQVSEEFDVKRPKSYLLGLKKALFGELKAVEKYRKIRRAMKGHPYRDILFDIITDEMKHASKFNYLIMLNGDKHNMHMMEKDMDDMDMHRNREIDKSQFTPSQWADFINPLVDSAATQMQQGMDPRYLFTRVALAGVLVGLGEDPQDAIRQVDKWEQNGSLNIQKGSNMSNKGGMGTTEGQGGMGTTGGQGGMGTTGGQGGMGTTGGQGGMGTTGGQGGMGTTGGQGGMGTTGGQGGMGTTEGQGGMGTTGGQGDMGTTGDQGGMGTTGGSGGMSSMDEEDNTGFTSNINSDYYYYY